jgi:hypothetical protein
VRIGTSRFVGGFSSTGFALDNTVDAALERGVAVENGRKIGSLPRRDLSIIAADQSKDRDLFTMEGDFEEDIDILAEHAEQKWENRDAVLVAIDCSPSMLCSSTENLQVRSLALYGILGFPTSVCSKVCIDSDAKQDKSRFW